MSMRLTTIPRFNWLVEPARTVGFWDWKSARTVGFCKLKIPHKKSGANRGGGTGGEGEGGGPILEHLKKIKIFLKMFWGTSQCPKGTGTH
jgi:hypothetical protein